MQLLILSPIFLQKKTRKFIYLNTRKNNELNDKFRFFLNKLILMLKLFKVLSLNRNNLRKFIFTINLV